MAKKYEITSEQVVEIRNLLNTHQTIKVKHILNELKPIKMKEQLKKLIMECGRSNMVSIEKLKEVVNEND